MNSMVTASLGPRSSRRASAARRSALWAAAAIIALSLTSCGGPGPAGNGPPTGNGPPHDDEGSLAAVPPGIVASVTEVAAPVDNPFGAFAVGLYPWPWDYGFEPPLDDRLATGAVSSTGQLSVTLAFFDEAQWEAAQQWPYPLCGETVWLATGVAVVSHGRHLHPAPYAGNYRSAYLRVATHAGPAGTVIVYVWYVYSDEARDLTCEGTAQTPDVDVRLRPGWNVFVNYTTTGGVYYRTGEPTVAVPWVGPLPVLTD
jgi:hypothetical protein